MKRLLDDPRFAAELRVDLLRSRNAGQDYATAAKLLQLRAAFSDNPPAAPAADSGVVALVRRAARAAHPGWKLAVLAALGAGAGLLVYPAREAPVQHAAVRQTAEVPPPTAASSAPALPAQNEPAPVANPMPERATRATEPATRATEPATRTPELSMPAPATRAPEPAMPEPTTGAPERATRATATATRALEPATRATAAAQLVPAAATRRASSSDSSRREIAQLVRMRALLDQDPAEAYRLGQRAEREFPRGILAEERQALSIVALANTGAKARARKLARRFLARYPQSPLRETLEAALQR